jgi:hypothetical protein
VKNRRTNWGLLVSVGRHESVDPVRVNLLSRRPGKVGRGISRRSGPLAHLSTGRIPAGVATATLPPCCRSRPGLGDNVVPALSFQ